MLLISGCQGEVEFTATATATSNLLDATDSQVPPTATPFPEPISSPLPTATNPAPPPTETPDAQICSPLEGVPLSGLAEIIYNPYSPPPPGSDDPHQGVDFAYTLPETGIGVSGGPVFSALEGQVAGVIRDRFPYGNAVIIETPLEDLPDIPGLGPPGEAEPQVSITLTCPEIELPLPDGEGRSLYSLYAHMESPPDWEIGDTVACGEQIGATGDSGNALNPHLHVEMRVGPSGAIFESMAHYETRASDHEMAGYCRWRVSGDFALVDPMALLGEGE